MIEMNVQKLASSWGFKQRAQLFSKRLRAGRTRPVDQAADWVEYALEAGGWTRSAGCSAPAPVLLAKAGFNPNPDL